jgi:hypothetical protein
MHTTTVAVDLARSVFQPDVADAAWRVTEHHRLIRSQFERWIINRNVSGFSLMPSLSVSFLYFGGSPYTRG